MVGIFTGAGLGLERGSANILGGRGQVGSASLGRGNEQVYVNAATGNLILGNRDEFLIGRGPDSAVNRTYNSQGQFTDDNGDNWLNGVVRQVMNSTAPDNTNGSTIERVGIDGNKRVYTYDSAFGGYVNKDGAGAHDIIRLVSGTWTWTDGDSGVTEVYGGPNHRISSATDRDGNTITYSYTGNNVSRITTADGNYTDLNWSGNNLVSVSSTYTDPQGATKTLTRTRYSYDGNNRLSTVTVDLSPEDNSIADGRTYVTTYGYDANGRVNVISQTDGTLLTFAYDGSDRVISFTQTVEAGVVRTTSIAYGSNSTTITDPQGNATTLYYDGSGQLVRVDEPSDTAGNRKVTSYKYNANGDLIETLEGYGNQNLLDLSGWAGAQRGSNLVDMAGWPVDPNNLPAGQGTVPGWLNYAADESRWGSATGPNGTQVAVLQTGQTDNTQDGGGNYTNQFAIDKSKGYEFSIYFQATELNKHRIYFGFNGSASVVDAATGAVDTNPYFAYPRPTGSDGIIAGRWYKIVGYILPAGSGNLTGAESLGGIYDVGTGERVQSVQNFKWNDSQSASPTGGIRFFNYYNEEIQGYYTNYYGPEARQLNLTGGPAEVGGWINGWSTDEARWTATLGPSGSPVWAIQAGQTNPDQDGGGNFSSEVSIDKNKAYEVSYYFKFSSIDQHYVLFGLNGSAPVENLSTGSIDTNPYFYYAYPGIQSNFVNDRWYKVVGYVLPQGSTDIPLDKLGGVFDTTTNEKVSSIYTNYRWAASGASSIGVRFFTYYYEQNQNYSTFFYQPELKEAVQLGSSGGYPVYAGEQTSRWQYFYDGKGNLVKSIDPEGNIKTRTYGLKNELLTETSYSGKGASALTGAMTTRYVYDSENHLRYTISAEGRVSQFNYDAAGNRTLSLSYTANIYTGTGSTETDLDNWVGTISDKSNIARTDTTYDFRGNISTVTTYAKTDASGNGLTGAGEYTRFTYVYDQYGNLLSKVSNDSGAVAETYAYDGMGRTIRFTDAKGVGTWTSYIDSQNRTVTTLANGLIKTSVYNRAGEMVASSEARGGVTTDNLAANLSNWDPGLHQRASAGKIDGADAYKYSIQTPGTWSSISSSTTVAAGDSVTLTMSLQAVVGSSTTQRIGLYGSSSGWGTANQVSVRIISGPGTLSAVVGGLWDISGLSTSEATRVEIIRYHVQDETCTAYLYVDEAGGRRAGQELIASAPTLIKSRYDTSASGGSFTSDLFNIASGSWGSGGLTVTDAGTIGGGSPARQYIVNATGQWAGVSIDFPVNPGDTVTTAISLKGAGGGTSTSLGLYGSQSEWDYSNNFVSSARIISGPGTLVQEGGGLWNITGLSSTQETRIEIKRTYDRAENYRAVYLYPNRPEGWIAGQGIIAGAPSIVRTPGDITSFKYDSLGRLRIKTDPVGTKSFYFYDKRGRLVGEVDQDGSVTEYKYDAADNRVASTVYATALTATQVASLTDIYGNPTAVEFASIRPAANGADRWNWNVYDKAGRLIQTIDAAGFSTSFLYDGAGRLTKTTKYSYAVSHYDASLLTSYKTAPPTAFVQAPWDSSVDRTTFNYYDNDGLLIGSVDEEMFVTEYLYDKAGRKVETIRYADAASSSYQPTGSFTSALPASWATVKASFTTQPSDIHNYWLYDGRGLLGATIDGEGNVTRYQYNARGLVTQEVVGGKVTASTSYTLASLPASSGTLDITNYQYDARGQMTLKQKMLWGGNYANTFYNYDSMGNLVSQTSNETLSSDTRSSTFRYDAKGRLIGELSGNGSAALAALGASPTQAQVDSVYATYGTRYVYDAADRLIQKIAPDGTGSGGNRTLYYYDSDGQLRYEINALGEVVEHNYDVFEQKSADIVYGTRLSTGTIASWTGGLLTSTALSSITSVANTALDSRTAYAYTNRGQVSTIYSPLYPATPTAENYSQFYYNAFGEVITEHGWPQSGQINEFDTAYFRRGLVYNRQQLLNGSGTGKLQNTYEYDAFRRVHVAHSNASFDRWALYDYDRANRIINEWDGFGWANYSQHQYDPRGNEISFRDRTGNVTTYAYDQHNRTVTTTTAEGIVSTVVKNAYGQTISITDGAGRVTSYTYDKNGNLKTVTDAAGTVTNNYDNADHLIETIDGRGTKTVFTYDAVGRVLTKVEDPGSGHLNITTSYAYDAKGQQVSVTDALGSVTTFAYDLKGQKTRVVQDAGSGKLNLTTDYVYRADGKVISMTEGVGTASARTTSYVYDSMGRLTEQHVDPSGLNLTTKYAWDVNGNIVATTDERGFVTRFVYDKENRQILSINAVGEVTETGYDAEGRAIWTQGYANRIAIATVNGWALEASEATVRASLSASSSDHINRTMYDKDGRVAYKIDGEGYTTRFVYDGANNLIKTIHYAVAIAASNGSTKATNDAYFDTYWGTVASPHPTSAVTTFAYDGANRLISTTDAEGFTESYQLDANGNRTQVTNKLGGIVQYIYDALGRLRYESVPMNVHRDDGSLQASSFYRNVYEYDALGHVTSQFEGYGLTEQRVTTFAYDAAGRMVTKTLPSINVFDPGTGATNLTGGRTETTRYDARGNVIETVAVGGARTLFYYDAADRKTVEINAAGTYTAYGYDAHGNLTSQRVYGTAVGLPGSAGGTPPAAPSGEYRETQYAYDYANRASYTITPNVRVGNYVGGSYSTSIQNIQTLFYVDAFGNVTQEVDGNGNSVYHWYDRNGREIQKQDAEGYVTTWARDGEGNVLTERRFAVKNSLTPGADDRVTTFTYDKNGRRLTETRQNVLAATVSGTGVLSTPALANATISYLYNGLGQVTRKTEANGDATNFSYDNQGRLSARIEAAHADQNGTNVQMRTDYYYDGLGNLVYERPSDSISGGSATATRYHYGAGGMLEWSMDAQGQKTEYFYDLKGRVQDTRVAHATSGGTTIQTRHRSEYDGLDRLISQLAYQWNAATGWDWGASEGTSYNTYGDVVAKSINGTIQEQFQYDGAGRVIKSNSGDGSWKLFVYDGNGNATLTISSAGYDLSGVSVDTALGLIGQADVNGTYAVYDKRNMVVQTVEEGRQLSSSSTQTLVNNRTYNAFGEMLSETDALGNTTDYLYNAMGRMIERKSAAVSITLENGATQTVRPTESYYYDISGRAIATRDANGNLTRQLLLAGSGHDGGGYGQGGPLVVKLFAADGGVTTTGYDVYGNARTITDQIGRVTTQSFDNIGRVTQVNHAGGLIDYYAYDGLGQRIKHWNNVYGSALAERTDYDARGRVISQIAANGDSTTTSYVWDGALSTGGLGSFGGWVETTTFANGKTSVSKTDSFGHQIAKTDMGSHIWSYSYDKAGRMTQSGTGGVTSSFTWFNTGQLASNSGTAGTATYSYDKVGNRLTEVLTNGGVTIKNQSATYDALGRRLTWAEAGTAKSPAASTSNEYDANGNIRRTYSQYRTIDSTGTASPYVTTRDYWYRYDTMDRLVTDKGMLSGTAGAAGTTVVRGNNSGNLSDGGRDILYDAAGQRISVATTFYYEGHWERVGDPNTLPSPDDEYVYVSGWTQEQRENYTFDAAGRLTEVRNQAGAQLDESMGSTPPGASPTGGGLRSTMVYDLLGRLTFQEDRGNALGTTFTGVTYSRSIAYNVAGQVTSDDVSTVKARYGNNLYDTFRSVTTYDYGSGTSYALGSVVTQSVTNTKLAYGSSSWSSQPGTLTTTTYAWFDGAVQDLISYDYDTGSGSNPIYTTDLQLNALGQLTGAAVNDGIPKTVAYTLDEAGQIIRRDESRNSAPSQGAPHEVFYRYAGRQVGMTGNNGTSDVGFTQSVEERSAARPDPTAATAGLFRNGMSTGAAVYADFSLGYDPYNSMAQGSSGGSYTVNQGDTLASIAQAIYGDANLWYRIAEVNGLTANSALTDGQILTLPTGVSRTRNSAGTSKPYDPADALGELSPSTPKPPKKAKCGMLGQLLLVAIAVAITVITAGPGAPILEQIGAAMLGSAVSQGVGVATGIQNKFSFKSVALAGIAAGVSAGLGKLASVGQKAVDAGQTISGLTKAVRGIGEFLNKGQLLNTAVRGAVSSGISQGIGVATGLQKKFDWAGVASAGVGAVVGTANFGSGAGGAFLATGADILAEAATRSVVEGSNFGDNILASLPSALGNLIGRWAASGVKTAVDGKGGAASGQRPSRVDSVNGGSRASSNSGTSGQTAGQQATDDLQVDQIVVTAQRSESSYLARYTPYELTLGARMRDKFVNILAAEFDAKANDAANKLQAQYRKEMGFPSTKAMIAAGSRAKVVEGNDVFGEGSASGDILEGLLYASREGQLPGYAEVLANPKNYNGGYFGSAGSVDAYGQYLAGSSYSDLRLARGALETLAQGDVYKAEFGKALGIVNARLDYLNDAARTEVNRLAFAGIGAPVLIAGSMAAAPLAGSYVATTWGGATVGSEVGMLAYYGTSFTVGGGLSAGFEYIKNEIFDLEHTRGGYVGAFLGGGLGATGWQMLGKGASTLANNIALGGLSGLVGDGAGQYVDIKAGNQASLDTKRLLISAGIGFAAGSAVSLDFNVSGLNAGRNSSTAIFKGLQTRAATGNIGLYQLRYPVVAGYGQGVRGSVQSGASAVYAGIYSDANR